MAMLLGVDLCISSSGGASVQMSIRDGTAAVPGSILATASATTTHWGAEYLHLDLDPPLAVSAGRMLVIETVSKDSAWRGTCGIVLGTCTSIDPDLYPPGQTSVPYWVGDFGFRTYGSNP